MIEICCDTCKKARPHTEDGLTSPEWMLGTDLEISNRSGLQRSLRFHNRWDDGLVLELGAIHFCSVACKEDYLDRSRAA